MKKKIIGLILNTFLVFSLFVPINVSAIAEATGYEVQLAEYNWTNLFPRYFFWGMVALLVALTALLVFLERKFHGLANLFNKRPNKQN